MCTLFLALASASFVGLPVGHAVWIYGTIISQIGIQVLLHGRGQRVLDWQMGVIFGILVCELRSWVVHVLRSLFCQGPGNRERCVARHHVADEICNTVWMCLCA